MEIEQALRQRTKCITAVAEVHNFPVAKSDSETVYRLFCHISVYIRLVVMSPVMLYSAFFAIHVVGGLIFLIYFAMALREIRWTHGTVRAHYFSLSVFVEEMKQTDIRFSVDEMFTIPLTIAVFESALPVIVWTPHEQSFPG